MLKVDKGVPIPKKGTARPKNQDLHDALSHMEIGDSIEFPADGILNNGTRYSKDGNIFRFMARSRGFKMTQRVNEDKSAIRFWRVK